MKRRKKIFEFEAFRIKVEEAFGYAGITEFAEKVGVSRTIASEWVNGKNNGPSATSWNKIEVVLAKRGVPVKRREFYMDPEDSAKPYVLPEMPDSGTKEAERAFGNDKQIIKEMTAELVYLKNAAADRNEMIASLVEENRELKAENKELKNELKKLKK